MTRHRAGLALTAGILAVGLGCTSEGEPPRDAQGPTGGTLTVAIDPPVTIDPTAVDVRDRGAVAITSLLCDTLVGIDPVSGDLVGGLAESWQVGGGGSRLTLKLRRDITFHDGTPITADDVVATLSRLARRDFAAPSAQVLEPIAGFEAVHGTADVVDERDRTILAGVGPIEAGAVEIALSSSRADFVRTLAHPATAIVPETAVDEPGFGSAPVCSGPYRLVEPARLERYEDYHGAHAAYTNGGRGYPDAVLFVTSGDGDVSLRADAHVNASWPTPALNYVGLPTTVAPFDAAGVRRAMSLALDRERIVASVYGGRATAATSLLPPVLDAFQDPCPNTPPVADPDGARTALGRAALGPAALAFNDEFGHRELAVEVATQWTESLGADLELLPQPWDAYIAAGRQQPGYETLFRLSWAPGVVSADAYLQPLFGAGSIGTDNLSRFEDPTFDRTLEREARRASDDEERRTEYKAAADIVCSQMPIVPLVWEHATAMVADGVTSAAGVLGAADGSLLVRELTARG